MPAPRCKRVYDAPAQDDGLWRLGERLWPRGLSKKAARIDLWIKQIAPSTDLRKQYHTAPEHWDAFREACLAELQDSPALAQLRELTRRQPSTLLFGWHDVEHSHATLLVEVLRRH